MGKPSRTLISFVEAGLAEGRVWRVSAIPFPRVKTEAASSSAGIIGFGR